MILLAVDYINKDCRMPEIKSHNKHVNTCICDVPSMPFPLLIVSVFFCYRFCKCIFLQFAGI